MTDPARKAYENIDKMADALAKRGVHLPAAYKRRDPREPMRVEKEMFEDKLAALIDKLFAAQAKKIRQHVEPLAVGRKAVPKVPLDVFTDKEIEAAILSILITMAQAGISIFDSQVEIGFDLAVFNAAAVEWARNHAGLLITQINNTTLKAVQEAIALFLETPGMTLGQLMDMLPFGEVRSRLIAVTETTNAFAQSELIAAKKLQKEFPDVIVERIWFTNNDPEVCVICRGLDGEKVRIGEKFVSRTTGGEYLTAGSPPTGPHIGDRCWVTHRTSIGKES
jgi:hypothetical protein